MIKTLAISSNNCIGEIMSVTGTVIPMSGADELLCVCVFFVCVSGHLCLYLIAGMLKCAYCKYACLTLHTFQLVHLTLCIF